MNNSVTEKSVVIPESDAKMFYKLFDKMLRNTYDDDLDHCLKELDSEEYEVIGKFVLEHEERFESDKTAPTAYHSA